MSHQRDRRQERGDDRHRHADLPLRGAAGLLTHFFQFLCFHGQKTHHTRCSRSWTCASSRSSRRSPRPARSPRAAGSCTCRSRRSAVRFLLLEEELGEPLFLRVGRQVRMTPAAESLVQLGQRVFQDVRETVGVITDRTRELTGHAAALGRHDRLPLRVPPLLKHLRRVHPHLDVRLTVATAERSVQEIRAGPSTPGCSRCRSRNPIW